MTHAATHIPPCNDSFGPDQREQATAWFRALRDRICTTFETIETELSGSTATPGTFQRTPWDRPGGGGGSASFIASCILQSSTDGSTWVFEKEFGRYPWAGVLAMNAVPSPDGDDAYPNVSLLLHGDDSFADSSSAPKTLTVANGTPTF